MGHLLRLALIDDDTASPASRRFASAPTPPGTQPLLMLGQASGGMLSKYHCHTAHSHLPRGLKGECPEQEILNDEGATPCKGSNNFIIRNSLFDILSCVSIALSYCYVVLESIN